MSAKDQNLVCFKAAAAVALNALELNLRGVIRCRIEDAEWDEVDVHADRAIGVALEKVLQMKGQRYPDWFAMGDDWWGAAGIVECAAAAFSRPDSYYGRRIKSLASYFEILADVIELTHPAFVKGVAA